MLFHTYIFFAFFALVFAMYWGLGNRWRVQNVLLLVASYVFYGWWDWRFLGLLAASSTVDFLMGRQISRERHEERRRRWLGVSLAFNFGILGGFKYFNFFAGSLHEAFRTLGITLDLPTLHVVLPVGISFYTFQSVSYTIDVFRRRLPAARDYVGFVTYVAFFPQLVAGPIERAAHMLPQFHQARVFRYPVAVHGCRLFLFGLCKKLLVADPCGRVADGLFNGYAGEQGWALAAGAVFFGFQIYGDFSGYSDMARGLAKLLGFELMVNFRTPYFSRSPREFWQRWHISLSTWFRDYLYFPLGGSRRGTARTCWNLLLVFLVSGLWHGASWNFVIWGGLHGLALALTHLVDGRRRDSAPSPEAARSWLGSAVGAAGTFCLVSVLWIFFRSPTLADALGYIGRMVAEMAAHPGGVLVMLRRFAQEPAGWAIVGLCVMDLALQRGWLRWFERAPALRWTAYAAGTCAALWIVGTIDPTGFIYFQF